MSSKKKFQWEKGSKRTFTGCWSCRSRGVKCDEKAPSCSQCMKHGKKCAGYRQNLVWVESSDFKKYKAGGRRLLELETWETFKVPDPSELDDIIARCDFELDDIDVSFVSCPPFGVFRTSVPILRETSDTIVGADPEATGAEITWANEVEPPKLTISLRSCNGLQIQDSHIFYNYVLDVAPRLMPFPDPRNPWSSYPALALHYSHEGQQYLLHALMAHSAVALANAGHDRKNMLATSAKYYVLAVRELRSVIGRMHTDYLSLLTTIITLIFTEMYHGNSKTWRPHLDGGWQFMLQQKQHQIWSLSDEAWYVTQSFCLIRIISDTTGIRTRSSPTEDLIIDCFLSCDLFGLTMGASRSLMRCISNINRLSQNRCTVTDNFARSHAIENILHELEDCRASDMVIANPYNNNTQIMNTGQTLSTLHIRAFIAGALIYFNQQFYQTPPCALATYVSEVIQNLTLFLSSGGVNFTLWPAFIAATEVYKESDKAAVRHILTSMSLTSCQNRLTVPAILEEVWRIREAQAAESGMYVELIKVDWQIIMHDLELDILLL